MVHCNWTEVVREGGNVGVVYQHIAFSMTTTTTANVLEMAPESDQIIKYGTLKTPSFDYMGQ